jgi:hypothetical protein
LSGWPEGGARLKGGLVMANSPDLREISRSKAEALWAKKQQLESERLTNREKEMRAQDEKTARLRGLRLAKEAADREERARSTTGGTRKKAAPTTPKPAAD